MQDLNLRHPPCKGEGSETDAVAAQQLTTGQDSRCTNGCTSESELDHIAADLHRRFSDEDCRRLAEMLANQSEA